MRTHLSSVGRACALHPLIARVLAARGITDPGATRDFLTPRLSRLTAPDSMADRSVGADRIAYAVKRRERIAVFGDYDVDGITSATLLTTVLRRLGAEVVALVGSRFDGGYGLSDAAVDKLLAHNPKVLITCDCGSSDHPRLERVRAAGVDAIVVDHHKVPSEALPVVAFLNPHRSDCGFAYKNMASVGLAFSVAAAVRARCCAALDLRETLDLVALGTVADVAPLDGDNRILTRAGLNRISDGLGCPGVRALLRESRLRHRVSARDVGFSVGPMLNAPGRLGSATPTLELLLSDNDPMASRLASELADANAKRKTISAEIVHRAMTQVAEVYGPLDRCGVVVAGDGWHPGVGGIVAGRLADQLGRAAVVVAFDGDVGVGSVRGPGGARLYDALEACREHLMVFGGHDGAAGLKIRRDQLEGFRAAFAQAVARQGPVQLCEEPVDTELDERDLASPLAADLEAMEPTGEGNPEVSVRVARARVRDIRSVGQSHLRATFFLGRRPVGAFVRDGIALREQGGVPAPGALTGLVGRLRTDPWNGPEALQIEVREFRAPA